MRAGRTVVALVALAAALLAPLVAGQFWMTLITQIYIYGLLALSVDLLLGHAPAVGGDVVPPLGGGLHNSATCVSSAADDCDACHVVLPSDAISATNIHHQPAGRRR